MRVSLRSSTLMVYPHWISFISSARTHGRGGEEFLSSLPANYRNSQLLTAQTDDANSHCYNATYDSPCKRLSNMIEITANFKAVYHSP